MKLLLLLVSVLAASLTHASAKSHVSHFMDSVEIRVVVSFTVSKSGTVSNIQVVEHSCKQCSKVQKRNLEQEAKRIIEATPSFPIKRDRKGNPQQARYRQAIVFKLAEEPDM